MHSLYKIICLLAFVLAVQARTQAAGSGQALGQAPGQAPGLVPGQIPLKDQSPAKGPDGLEQKPKQPEEPRENIVDHIAKACPGLQPQVDRLKEEIAHPNQYCRFYLSQRRMRSPIVDMNADLMMKGCVCLLKQDGMGITSSSSQPPQTFIPAQTSVGQETMDCNPQFEEIIKAEYHEFRHFCKFFGTSLRRVTPIPGLSPEQVMEGCKCILENRQKTPYQTASRSQRTQSPVTEAPAAAKTGSSAGAITTSTIILKTIIVSRN
ncbi:hypothetical protein K461DRAFT_309494 [Myriangium duriaei CBS 260.36]|uniref:Uncharacterized protein n=1 Tax=Myriangium duriaei CBS 260.36 TaxID=1168546 RepID=A0A9P4JEH0_9PEZI|nr:hypothetical protein K461DRAFT_309494 [Myriangium duriaei CBS 260.36]